MPTDRELLRQYADHGDEAAFAELVSRHADLVYSVAKRVTCNGALAEDVTQAAFTTIAQQARRLMHYESLLGWLHTAARHRAIDAVRGEARRHAREQEATAMQNIHSAPESNWAEIGPLLDEAVGQLREQDREAVLLRFFKHLNYQEVGGALGLGEDAARKRVDRALEKLRDYFARRGVMASSTLLATAIAENSVEAAPSGLAANVAQASLAAAGVTTGGFFLKILLMSTPAKLVIAAVVILVVAAITMSWPRANQPAKEYLPILLTTDASSKPAKSAALAQVEKPVLPPATPSGSSTSTDIASASTPSAPVSSTPSSQFVAGPQTDLNAAIATGLHFLVAQDSVSFFKTLMPPEAFVLEGKGSTAEDFAAQISKDPRSAQKLNSMLEALSALANLTPQENPITNRATYHLDPPVGGHKVVIFNQVDGFWYLDGM